MKTLLKRRWVQVLLFLFSITALALGVAMAWTSHLPDFPLQMERVVTADLPIATVNRSIDALANWPDWHHWAIRAEAISGNHTPLPVAYQSVTEGGLIRLSFRPKKNPKRDFQILVHVQVYRPAQGELPGILHLNMISESAGKISELAEQIEWKLEWKSTQPQQTEIRLWLHAQTRSDRARFLGTYFEKIFLNQLLQVDLSALAHLKYPSPVIPTPPASR
jgi:hypothetical protein